MSLSHYNSPIIPNSPWYVVSVRWFSKWLKHIHSSDDCPKQLGPVDNSSLCNSRGIVDLDGCIEGIDYVTVPAPLWTEWCSQFGVLPCAMAQDIKFSQSLNIGQAFQLAKVLLHGQCTTADGRVARSYRVEAKPMHILFTLSPNEASHLLEKSNDSMESSPTDHQDPMKASNRKRHRGKRHPSPSVASAEAVKCIDWSPQAALGLLIEHIRTLCKVLVEQPMRLWYTTATSYDSQAQSTTEKRTLLNGMQNGDRLPWELLVSESGFRAQSTANSLCLPRNLIILVDIQSENGEWSSGLSSPVTLDTDRISSSLITQRAGLCGLTNMGNTCYMNSGLQCLSHVMPLVKYFLNFEWRPHVNLHNRLGHRGRLAAIIHNFFKVMWCGLFVEIQPSGLKSFIDSIAPQFSGNMQHDCQEMLSFLLDGLHEDLNRVPTKPFRELPDSDGRPDEIVADEWISYLKSRDDSIITDLFRGFLKSTVTCTTCRHTSVKFDPFTTLNLPIPTDKERQQFGMSSTPTLVTQRVLYLVRCGRDVHESLTAMNGEEDEQRRPWISAIPLHITHSSTISVKRLLYALSRREDLPYHELVLTEVSECRIRRIVAVSDSLASLSPQRDIVVYHLPQLTSSFALSNHHLCLVHQLWSSHAHGIPFLHVLPSMGKFHTSQHLLVPILKQLETMCPPSFLDSLPLLNRTISSDTDVGHNPSTPRRPKKKRRLSLDSDDDTSVEECGDAYFEADVEQQEKCDAEHEEVFLPRLAAVVRCSLLNSRGSHTRIVLKWSASREECEDEWLFGADMVNPEVFVEWDHETLSSLNPDSKALLSWKKQVELPAEATLKLVGEAPPMSTNPTLENCLQAFLQPETLDETNTYYCKRCKSQKIACKKMDLWELPDILILHFKRVINPASSMFSNYHTKQLSTVIYPVHELDMSPWILGRSNESHQSHPSMVNNDHLYDLIAVANHYGRLNFGHYTTTLKHEPLDQWFEFDDESVSAVRDERNLVTSQAYLLVYQRRPSAF